MAYDFPNLHCKMNELLLAIILLRTLYLNDVSFTFYGELFQYNSRLYLSFPLMLKLFQHTVFLPRCSYICRCGIGMNDQYVSPSVRPFVKLVDCDRTKETSAHILIPYEMLMFCDTRLVGTSPSTSHIRPN